MGWQVGVATHQTLGKSSALYLRLTICPTADTEVHDLSFFDVISLAMSQTRHESGHRRTNSAMAPITYYMGMGGGLCFAGAYALSHNEQLSTILVMSGIALIGFGALIAGYFAVLRPELLHSEEHITQQRQLALIETKGNRIPMNPVDLQAIANPYQNSPAIAAKAALAIEEGDNREI